MDHFSAPDVPGFLVRRLLGRGGSSTVWLVTEEKTGREYALKCLGAMSGGGAHSAASGPHGAADQQDVRREIRILSVLDHQHLIKAHDAVRFARTPGEAGTEEAHGGIGLLLDYAPGGSLAELVANRGSLPVGETVTVLTPIAQALGYLHAKGFTHGDVAPGNVLFTGHGKPVLSDVGIARMVGDASAVPDYGTAGFTDPTPVDAVRAGLQPERDVYAVAALGWYCLTGEPPRRSADRPPLSLVLPDVPPELTAALESGLNEDRRLRPTAVELATAIYRSAPPLPIDLSSSVHATVIPQLLTQRRDQKRSGGVLLTRAGAWRRKLSTSRWSGLFGARQVLPFPAGGERTAPRGKHAEPAPLADTADAPVQRSASHRILRGHPGPGRRGRQLPRAGRGLGTMLLAAGAVAVVAGAIWVAGVWGPAGPLAGVAGPLPESAGQQTGSLRDGSDTEASGPAAGSDVDHTAAVPAHVDSRLGSANPAEAVHGLAAVRSLAFSSGRLELLDLVNAPGSTSAAADARLKASLEESGHVLAGFTSTVSDVQVQPGGSAERVVVRVRSATSPYEERDGSGVVVAQGAPGTDQVLRLALVSLEGRWLITDVLPDP